MVKKELSLLFIMALFSGTLLSQNEDQQGKSETANFITGQTDRMHLQNDSLFNAAFKQEYSQYDPDQRILKKVEPEIYMTSVTIVLGTWCSDSREQVPRFYKILDNLNYNSDMIQVIGVDKNKQAGNHNIEELRIEKVPTFIFYQNGREIGRIIETPQVTIEKDILKILEQK
ncbi:MAG: thioredoxin family protein [Bacteroidales bacterium]|nr:thioredoxin family protein [Bacteroidales bacterium]